MSDTPFKDALSKPLVIPDVPKDAVTVIVEKNPQDMGASIVGHTDFKGPGGAEAGVQAGWWQTTGATIRAWFTWRK